MFAGALSLASGFALIACSSDDTPSTPTADAGAGNDAGGASSDADAGVDCAALSARYDTVAQAPENVSCTQKADCQAVPRDLCYSLGDYPVNAKGKAAASAIAQAHADANCNAPFNDCGSGGGYQYGIDCHAGTCVRTYADGGAATTP